MSVTYSQCPFCGTSIVETENFQPRVWLAAHMKSCVGVEVKVAEEKPKKKGRGRTAAAQSPVTEVTARIGEVVAKEFIKQLFKKG